MTAESSSPPSFPPTVPQTAHSSAPAPQGASLQGSEQQAYRSERSSPGNSNHQGSSPQDSKLRQTKTFQDSKSQDSKSQDSKSQDSKSQDSKSQDSKSQDSKSQTKPPGCQDSGGSQGVSRPQDDVGKALPVQANPKAKTTAAGQRQVDSQSPSSPVQVSSNRQAGARAGAQIQLKTEQGRLRLHIPPPKATPLEWSDLWQQLQQRLDAGKRFWTTHTSIEVLVGDRLLDQRQLQQLAASLAAVNLHVERIHTIRRQTAVAAVSAGYSVEQQVDILPLSQSSIAKFKTPKPAAAQVAEPLYLQTTLRSGSEIRHPGTVVIVGDLNPGSTVIANDDIMVWGRLRGIAHAGAEGNRECRIMALQMEPTQLRIADLVARAPDQPPTQFYPEVAHIADGRIQITQAAEFAKNAAPPLAQLGNKA